MNEFSIETLARIIKAEPLNAERYTPNAIITGVSIDSRTTAAGDCFFAIAGKNFNGADFIADAFAVGATCAVISRGIVDSGQRDDKKLNANNILRVDDTIKALGDFAKEYRLRMGFKVVAITGSVGKTMTRQIAHHVLSRHFKVFQSPKNFNNDIGLPLTLLGADPEDRIVIVELGSNHPGEIVYLARIAQPDIAVVTNVYLAHLAGFGDLQTIIQEKLSILQGLRSDGVLIINAHIANRVGSCGSRITSSEIVTFGKSDDCDIQAGDITHTGLGSSFTIDGTRIYLSVPGLGNVENTLAAFSVCRQFGLTIDDFADAVKTFPAVPMRTELLQIGTLTVLNDCYNANPASMKNALGILTNLKSDRAGRLVFICGDMAELAEQSEQLHAELGTAIAQAKVQLLVAVGRFAKITAEVAMQNADYDLQTKYFKDSLSACNSLEKFIEDYDIVLVKGSRIAKLEIVIEKLKALFL